VSPWKSVYKIHRLADTTITFCLTNGGHNAGIVSEPGHARRHHALATRPANGPWQDPEAWQAAAPVIEGSWWPSWQRWLVEQGSGRQVPARQPAVVPGLPAAPGEYVHQCYSD
jgi:polyhydroxyalkanoate synthase